ncbi:MAG: hypothetical protein O7G88_06170, partial [bacterium]|nr:hypothetical protein [bacterium]
LCGPAGRGGSAGWPRRRRHPNPLPIATEPVQNTALCAFQALACRDWGRVDMRVGTDGRPQVLELNPIAGIDPTYWLPRAARAAGMDYAMLIHTILEAARQRYGL